MAYRVSSTVEAAQRKRPSRERDRAKYGKKQAADRDAAVALVYKWGGSIYVNWVRHFYRTHENESLRWSEPYFEDFFTAVGNLWLETIYIEKPAQIGFTECLVAFSLFFLAFLRLPFALGFEEQKKLQQMVGKRVQPSIDNCEVIQKLSLEKQNLTKRKDIDSKETITIGGVPLSLFYASTQADKKNDQKYQTPASLRSFTAFGFGGDEWGLWRDGVIDILKARAEQTFLPTKPIRAGSTPGYEGSPTDVEMRRAKYLFEWQCCCPHCNKEQFLDAFGNFLRPVLVDEDGGTEEVYVNSIGRPLEWFHHSKNPEGVKDADLTGNDLEAAFSTAYVGCSYCEEELPFEAISLGEFICRNTGISLGELERNATRNQKPVIDSIGIRLPKLASLTFRPAERIRYMWFTKKPDDGIHQFLGKTFSLGGGKISLNRLITCIGSKVPFTRKPDFVVAGIDQGRNANYCIVQEWYLGTEGDKDRRWLEAHVNVIHWEEFQTFEHLDGLAKQYNIAMFFVDNEPEFQLAAGYAMKHLPLAGSRRDAEIGQVYLLDQVQLKGEQYKRNQRDVQSTRKDTKIVVYSVDRTYAIDCVKWRIYRRRQHFPEDLTYNPKDPGNLLHHYVTSDRTPDGRWVEPPGEPDHYLNANSLCEIGVQFSAYEPGQKKMVFASSAKR